MQLSQAEQPLEWRSLARTNRPVPALTANFLKAGLGKFLNFDTRSDTC
jgi:hypothetical protein